MIRGLNTADMISISKSAERTEARLERVLNENSKLRANIKQKVLQIADLERRLKENTLNIVTAETKVKRLNRLNIAGSG